MGKRTPDGADAFAHPKPQTSPRTRNAVAGSETRDSPPISRPSTTQTELTAAVGACRGVAARITACPVGSVTEQC